MSPKSINVIHFPEIICLIRRSDDFSGGQQSGSYDSRGYSREKILAEQERTMEGMSRPPLSVFIFMRWSLVSA